jgi:hypothetical protein
MSDPNLLIDQYGTDAGAHAARLKQDAVWEADPEPLRTGSPPCTPSRC